MGKLQDERNQLLIDLWNGVKPKRVPVSTGASLEYALEINGYSLLREYYIPEKCFEVADKMASLLNSDNLPTPSESRAPVFRYTLNRFMVPGDDGYFQHPNYSPMKLEEYPELIKDPFAFWTNVIRPRAFGIVEEDPYYGNLRMEIADRVLAQKWAPYSSGKLVEKYERENVEMMTVLSMTPYDYIADYFRNFSDICLDIRRKPEWVLEACESMLGFVEGTLERAAKPEGKIPVVSLPLHMPPFMKAKDYDRFYMPTFVKLIQKIHDYGLKPSIYCEQNWNAHLDSLNELPGRVKIGFELADPKLVVEKVDKRHFIYGFFDASLLRTSTPDKVKDEAKKLLDIAAVNGNYSFSPDKNLLRKNDGIIENVQAMIEAVLEYGVY